MLTNSGLRRRAIAAAIHLSISTAVAAIAAVLVFGLWYPGAFRLLAGGRELFLLVTSVDVVLGPLLTFAVFNEAKGRSRLRLDLAVIGVIQMTALAYGVHTVYVARPVAMVFEVDRLRMVTVSDIPEEEMAKAPPQYRALPMTGPWLLGARRPARGAESNDAMFQGVGGVDVGQRPIFWQPYEQTRARALERSRPISLLLAHYPEQIADSRQRLAAIQADESTARFLPVVARGAWVAVLDKTGNLLGYLPLDGFF